MSERCCCANICCADICPARLCRLGSDAVGYGPASTQPVLGLEGEEQSLALKSPMTALFRRVPSCGSPCPALGVLSPGSAGGLAGSAAFPDTHCSLHRPSFSPGDASPQPSQGPCLSLPNAESFLTALLQFLAQEKSLSRNIIGPVNEQTDVVWKLHTRQACLPGYAHPKHLSFSYKSPVFSAWMFLVPIDFGYCYQFLR